MAALENSRHNPQKPGKAIPRFFFLLSRQPQEESRAALRLDGRRPITQAFLATLTLSRNPFGVDDISAIALRAWTG
jgi:hypothetical protein